MAREVPEEAEALLAGEPLVAHLATCHDDVPHVAPVWYTYRDGVIEIATTGRKLANIRANGRVALSVQKDDDGDPQWGMTVQGTASVVEDAEEGEELLRRLNRRYGVDDDAWSDNTPVRIAVTDVNYWRY